MKRPENEPKRAFLSVFDKSGIATMAARLVKLGFEIYSSGGTAKHIIATGMDVTDIAEVSGYPAILDHRVVTLQPQVHGGLLAKSTPEHDAERKDHNIPWFDLVCVDPYPLAPAIADGLSNDKILELIDIGGPSMLSSGAKGRRIVIGEFADRELVLAWLEAGSPDSETFLEGLAAKSDFIVSRYRMLSARHFGRGQFEGFHGTRIAEGKGENGPQSSSLYATGSNDPLSIDKFQLLEGSAMSFNNLCDVDRAVQVASALAAGMEKDIGWNSNMAIGVKHGNPCGVGVFTGDGSDHWAPIKKMVTGDPLSIFGGSVLVNYDIGNVEAEMLLSHGTDGKSKRILDVVIAPLITSKARDILRRKNDACKMLVNPALASDALAVLDSQPRFRHMRGGFLMQDSYPFVFDPDHVDLESNTTMKDVDFADVILAWAIGSRSNSNTVTIVKDGQLLGNGVGQQSRVDAAELAIDRATKRGHDLVGATAYSDSFFPFPDAPEVLAEAGITTIFATRGSKNDAVVAKAMEEAGVTFITIPDSVARGFFGH